MRFLSLFSRKTKQKAPSRMAGRERVRIPSRSNARSYDAAATTRHNKNHWLYADGRDADSTIRQDLATLRNRTRYEVRNNSYAKGITETRANDTIGSGPQLQIQTDNPDLDSEIENKFRQWCEICDSTGKLNFADMLKLAGSLQQDESGEAFIVLTNAPRKNSWINATPAPQLRLTIIEPDRVTTPTSLFGTGGLALGDDKIRDGIEYDSDGKPVAYYILKKHPGAMNSFVAMGGLGEYDRVPASQVIHLFRMERPGQSRGVPWLTPALPLLPLLRRYTLATVEGAEQAANISAVMKTEAEGTEEDEVESMDEVEIPRNSMLTLPSGSEMQQFKSEQPTTTYEMFKHELINEIARCLNMPFNVAAANSSKYNYASGRLDWQVYYRSIKTVRAWLQVHVTNRIFHAWLREAALIPGYLKNLRRTDLVISPAWFWPGQEHVDPAKEALAQERRLKSFTTNLSIEYSREGRDWDREIKQRVKEIKLLKELGIITEKDANKTKKDIARAVQTGVLR